MISTVIVERKSTIGSWFNHQWTEVHDTIGAAARRCRELNQGWLRRKQFDQRALMRFRQPEEIEGTCSICNEVVFCGDENDDQENLFDYPVHDWCVKSLDSHADLYPTYRESIQ